MATGATIHTRNGLRTLVTRRQASPQEAAQADVEERVAVMAGPSP
jgi:hypothetical protein